MKMMRDDELEDSTLLVLCNKQDLPNAMPKEVRFLFFSFLVLSFLVLPSLTLSFSFFLEIFLW